MQSVLCIPRCCSMCQHRARHRPKHLLAEGTGFWGKDGVPKKILYSAGPEYFSGKEDEPVSCSGPECNACI